MAIMAGLTYKPMALTEKDLKDAGYRMPKQQDARIEELMEDPSKLPADFATKSADYKEGAAFAVEYITGMVQAEIALRKEFLKLQQGGGLAIPALMGIKDDLEELGREIG